VSGAAAGRAARRARRLARAAACIALTLPLVGASPERDPGKLRAGLFLYAVPGMADPNFAETVVLLVEHSSAGSLGLVVNRPTREPLRERLKLRELDRSDLKFYWGGPVQPEAILALVRASWPSESARVVVGDVFVTGDMDDVRAALRDRDPGSRLRVFSGYAGWGKGQLANEVRAGGWALDRADARAIFSPDVSELWYRVHRILERLEARARW
jgi:putative transcriptional regulator